MADEAPAAPPAEAPAAPPQEVPAPDAAAAPAPTETPAAAAPAEGAPPADGAPPAEGAAPPAEGAPPVDGAPPAEGEAPVEPPPKEPTPEPEPPKMIDPANITEIKLIYFNVKALGEPLRFLLAYSGVEWKDVRVTRFSWPKVKPSKIYLLHHLSINNLALHPICNRMQSFCFHLSKFVLIDNYLKIQSLGQIFL